MDAALVCPEHRTTEQRGRIEALDERADPRISWTQDGVDWPHGPDIDVRRPMLDWAERLDVRQPPSKKWHRCIHWLVKGRCRYGDCGSSTFPINESGWADHVSGWIGETERVLIAHPHMEAERLKEIGAEISRWERLSRVVVYERGWYGTPAIELAHPRTTEPGTCAFEFRPDFI